MFTNLPKCSLDHAVALPKMYTETTNTSRWRRKRCAMKREPECMGNFVPEKMPKLHSEPMHIAHSCNMQIACVFPCLFCLCFQWCAHRIRSLPSATPIPIRNLHCGYDLRITQKLHAPQTVNDTLLTDSEEQRKTKESDIVARSTESAVLLLPLLRLLLLTNCKHTLE